MKSIDPKGLAGYNSGVEKGRLHRSLGLIEFARTKEILLEELPPPPAVIYDIGGAYGEYAYWLASLGYEVHLFDLAEEHIRMAKDMAGSMPAPLESAEVADARCIPRTDASADAILLFGPITLWKLMSAAGASMSAADCSSPVGSCLPRTSHALPRRSNIPSSMTADLRWMTMRSTA